MIQGTNVYFSTGTIFFYFFTPEAFLLSDTSAAQGRIQTETKGGLQKDNFEIRGSGGMPPTKF